MNQEEKDWGQYEKHIDLYKFYLDIAVKINAFHFAISGAIISFYFANKQSPDIQWALMLPALMSFCLMVFFAFGAITNLVTRKDVFRLRESLGLKVAPELLVLTVFLGIYCLANLLTLAGTVYIMTTHCI